MIKSLQLKVDKKELARELVANALARCEQIGITVVLSKKSNYKDGAHPLRIDDLVFRLPCD